LVQAALEIWELAAACVLGREKSLSVLEELRKEEEAGGDEHFVGAQKMK
jgi:hypothetical protein